MIACVSHTFKDIDNSLPLHVATEQRKRQEEDRELLKSIRGLAIQELMDRLDIPVCTICGGAFLTGITMTGRDKPTSWAYWCEACPHIFVSPPDQWRLPLADWDSRDIHSHIVALAGVGFPPAGTLPDGRRFNSAIVPHLIWAANELKVPLGGLFEKHRAATDIYDSV
jgi:hypothetical protein